MYLNFPLIGKKYNVNISRKKREGKFEIISFSINCDLYKRFIYLFPIKEFLSYLCFLTEQNLNFLAKFFFNFINIFIWKSLSAWILTFQIWREKNILTSRKLCKVTDATFRWIFSLWKWTNHPCRHKRSKRCKIWHFSRIYFILFIYFCHCNRQTLNIYALWTKFPRFIFFYSRWLTETMLKVEFISLGSFGAFIFGC